MRHVRMNVFILGEVRLRLLCALLKLYYSVLFFKQVWFGLNTNDSDKVTSVFFDITNASDKHFGKYFRWLGWSGGGKECGDIIQEN